MRVTFLAINYAPSVGGAQSLVRRVAEGLVTHHGHQVAVVTTDALRAPGGPDPGRVEPAEEWIGGVRVLRFPVARRTHTVLRSARRVAVRAGRPITPSPAVYGPLGLKFALGARRMIHGADVAVGVSAPFTTGPVAERCARGTDTAYVGVPLLHLGDWQPSDRVVAPLRRADRCITNTEFERAWLGEHGVDVDRVAVVPPGCDPGAFADLSPQQARAASGLPERPTVAFIGRLMAHKGIDTVLAALPAVAALHPDVTLLLAGQRSGFDVEAALAALPSPVADRVVVREDFAEADKATMFSAADVVVFPSREEAFGIVTIEAWAARRPIVVADVGAIGTVVRSGVDGEVVPVDDPGALAGAVSDLLADPARRARYGEAGRRRVEDTFDWVRVVGEWDGVLRAAVASRRGTGPLAVGGG